MSPLDCLIPTQQLSPGEQQRLAAARLLLVRPVLAFLDEATSALDLATEKLVPTHASLCRQVLSALDS